MWFSCGLGAALVSLTDLTGQAPGAALSLHSPLTQHSPHLTRCILGLTCLTSFHPQLPYVLGSFSSDHTGGNRSKIR